MTLVGCTWAGVIGAGASRPSAAASGWSPRDDLPSGLPSSSLWTTHVTWSRVDAIRTGLPARTQLPGETYLPGPLDMVAVAGRVVVVATVRSGIATPDVVTLRFINARTGALIVARSLSVWNFTGIRADTIGGEPVVEARYGLTAEQGDVAEPFVDAVFDTSGRQVWTNGGRLTTNVVGAEWVVNDAGTLVTGGHTLWFHTGTDALNHGGSYTVQDLSGRVLLTVPRWASVDPAGPVLGTLNSVQLVGGYAVVIQDGLGKTAAAAPHARFTVYDLSRGAKVVAAPTVTFPLGPNLAHPGVVPPNPDSEAHVVAACGGKLVLTLTDASWSGPSSVRVTVLDIATGRTTPPVDVPSVRNATYAGVLSGLADAACTTMVLNGQIVRTGPAPVLTSIAIDLSKGTLLWQRPELGVTYHYLSIHDGVIYALRDPTQSSPGRLIAIAAATGATLGTGFTAVPLAYTADGTPIFAKVPNDPALPSPSPSTTLRGGRYFALPPPQLSLTVGVQVWAGQPAT